MTDGSRKVHARGALVGRAEIAQSLRAPPTCLQCLHSLSFVL
jgi:hypothetical protein